jgi:hypothetical protein
MPFAFTKRGSIANVSEFVKKQTENGTDGKPIADQSLIESAKASALAKINILSKKFNAVWVNCEGHDTENNLSDTVQVCGEDHA